MDFKRIFTKEKDCPLWSVCYPEHEKDGKPKDIFRILLKKWNDDEFLDTFFNENEEILNKYWEISIDEAFERVKNESLVFEVQLSGIINNKPQYVGKELKDLFKRLHVSSTSGITINDSHRKGKPDLGEPMIRLYAIELDDETIIITGGGIKLYDTMQASNLDGENNQLRKVQQYLSEQNIRTREDLLKQFVYEKET